MHSLKQFSEDIGGKNDESYIFNVYLRFYKILNFKVINPLRMIFN